VHSWAANHGVLRWVALPRRAGPAGDRSDPQLNLRLDALNTMRDADFVIGSGIQTLRNSFFASGSLQARVVCTSNGPHCGFGSSYGDGGAGGAAGAFVLTGVVLSPPPSQSADLDNIQAFSPDGPIQRSEDNYACARISLGAIREISSKNSVISATRASGTVTGRPL